MMVTMTTNVIQTLMSWLTGYANHSRHSYRVPWNLHYLTIILFSKQYWEGLTVFIA